MTELELIPLVEAARRLGISRMTLSRLVKEGRFTVYTNPLDRRQRLFRLIRGDARGGHPCCCTSDSR